ncbi:uncharacterized protein LOC132284778 [Cornus florida]|uniref:uncharacterized protein LOC132284778 n=1 Tax=Cornus florida TaxID=4283 RepID=UPI00289F31ED|nr:uncharacterized protein LOC132284778 [Cornus florida]
MCRGFQQYDRLKIKDFYLRLSVSNAHTKTLPDSLTLYYLPRISESPLDVDGSNIRPDSPAFVTLHRLISSAAAADTVSKGNSGAIYGSRERVRASEGVRFEVYLRDEKLLKGIFRKDEDDDDQWKLDCKCVLERDLVGVDVKEAEVCVAAEGHAAAMAQTVEMVVKRKRRVKCFQGLEEIPEEREVDDTESDGCYCGSCSCSSNGDEVEMRSGGGGWSEEDEIDENRRDEMEIETEMEGVRWAVDVGIWVMCLGVGFLVSKASSKTLRPRRLL